MGKGRFVNQKLGKNISRKVGLLKSELAGRASHKVPPRPLPPSAPMKKTSRAKPE